MNPSGRIGRLFATFVVLLGLAAILPRFVGHDQGDLASGTAAAVMFLGLFSLAGIVAVVLLVLTLRAGPGLTPAARIMGLVPLPLAMAAGIAFILLVRQHRESAPPPRATVAPIAPPKSP